MVKKISPKHLVLFFLMGMFWACKTPELTSRPENKNTPAGYISAQDSTNSAKIQWREYFTDPYLSALIDTALRNNQELNIVLQEINISKNEIRARQGEYLPFVNVGAGIGIDKSGEYTRNGAVEENLEIKPGKEFPKPLPDFMVGVYASWELDVWKKLRNAKKAAVLRYAASAEGRNFLQTNLVAEITNSYYELMALDNMLSIVRQNMDLQSNALSVIKLEKEAAKVTQLAVNRFEAQLLNTQNLQYEILQKIVEAENRINFLAGRFPQPIERNSASFNNMAFGVVNAGIPSQLLVNRPDIRQAELELAAARLDIKVAKANFYPQFRLTAGVGLQSFNPVYLLDVKSILYNLAGDMIAPLVNRNAIKANYLNANAKQIQAIYNYEQTILNAHIEVINQLNRIDNFTKSFETKSKEVDILTQSINISNSLFRSARADYVEVLLTQREALESRIDLVEIKLKQMQSKVNIYKALGGGWN
ncbi:TolC family protein [Pollutibacter soli]|uniref:TolC family protein n=1 Tax=Pollutibacter soli TaxID=3034157 RepID=UPI003013711B